MLSKAVASSTLGVRRLVWAWVRRLAIVLMLVATPGPADLVQEVVAFATGIECCNGHCDDSSGQCCPKSCSHCRCCAHFAALLPTALELPSSSARRDRTYASRVIVFNPIDERAPPARPPDLAAASNAST